MPPPHPKVCAVSPVRASVGRRLAAGEAATAEESATADAWYDEWAVRLECWLLSLPPLDQALAARLCLVSADMVGSGEWLL